MIQHQNHNTNTTHSAYNRKHNAYITYNATHTIAYTVDYIQSNAYNTKDNTNQNTISTTQTQDIDKTIYAAQYNTIPYNTIQYTVDTTQ